MRAVRPLHCLIAGVILVFLIGGTMPAQAATTELQDGRLPGVTLAEGMTQATGVAISPLLGVSVMGAAKYFHTAGHLRHLLPWYCQPMFWGTGLMVVSLRFLKDTLGMAVPQLIRKPLDFAQLFENKASALVTSTAFLPLLAKAMAQVSASPHETAAALNPASLGLALASVDFSWLQMAVALPLLVVCFSVVWLASHAINVLAAISPFRIAEAVLKLFKLGLFGIVMTCAYFFPNLGLVICVPIILGAALISGWAFRLTVFGTLFGCDLLLFRRERCVSGSVGCKGFAARALGAAPARTYGRLCLREDGTLAFRYRPWLLLPRRELPLNVPHETLMFTRGMIHPALRMRDAGGAIQQAFILRPCYRSSVDELGPLFYVAEITDSPLLSGLKAVRGWFREIFGRSPVPAQGL